MIQKWLINLHPLKKKSSFLNILYWREMILWSSQRPILGGQKFGLRYNNKTYMRTYTLIYLFMRLHVFVIDSPGNLRVIRLLSIIAERCIFSDEYSIWVFGRWIWFVKGCLQWTYNNFSWVNIQPLDFFEF